MNGKCRLCGNETELLEGHIIPSFVFKWLKETSGTGYIRSSGAPDRRIQDGPKRYYLCEACERLFNGWETQFANMIFHPCNEGKTVGLPYGDWMLKFAVSVSWRVLLNLVDKTGLSSFPERLITSASDAMARWKDFLLGDAPHPAQFEQHMLPLGPVESYRNMEPPPNINRYFLRMTDADVVHGGEKVAYVYSKMGRLVLVGFIEMPHSERWSQTKLHVRKGEFGRRHYVIDDRLREYLFSRAEIGLESQSSLSPKQKKKIAQSYEKDKERGFKSDTFQALNYDVDLFGEEAVFDEAKEASKR